MKKTLDKVFRCTDMVMGAFLALMVLFVLLNVILRFCFNSGLKWSEEAARYLFVWSIYIGAIGAARDNQHILVKSLLEKLPNISQKIIYLVGQVVSFIILLMLAWGSYLLSVHNLNSRAAATGLPMYFVYGVGIFLGVGIAAVHVSNIYHLLFKNTPVIELLQIKGDPDEMEKVN